MTKDRPTAAERLQAPAGQFAIAATVLMLGFLLAIQLRATEGLAERLSVEREEDLGQILTELTARNDQLFDQILELRLRLERTAGTEEQERALVAAARRELESLEILLGVVPVRGPGVIIEIADTEGTVGPEVLLDAVQELRDAGAEAIEIGTVRVVANTAFGGAPRALTAGGRRLSSPYEIRAIGDAGTLAEAMRIPGGLSDAISAREGASVRVRERRSVSILSTNPHPTFRYARPQPRR